MITAGQFKSIFPSCPKRLASVYLPLLVAAMREFGIVSKKRAAAYLSQLGHESADLKYFEEIASGAAYEGRKDLGNFRPGDGRKFKGRGPIQTTGRLNYTSAGIALRLPLDEQPELLARPAHGFRASAYFWRANKLNIYADALTGRGDAKDIERFDKITRRVNGGYNGRVDRERRYLVALRVLTDTQFADARLEQTLSALTLPAAAASTDAPLTLKPGAQVVSQTEASAQSQSAQTTATPQPAGEDSLFDEIPITENTKAVVGSILKRLGFRIGTLICVAWTSGLVTRALLIAAALVLAGTLYVERKRLKTHVLRLMRKFKGAQ